MQSFLAKCAAFGIVAGGFAVTGDLGMLAERGQRLLDARTVPSETATETSADRAADADPVAVAQALPVTEAVASPSTIKAQPPQPPAARPTPAHAAPPASGEVRGAATMGRAAAVPAPPAAGPDSVDLARLVPGSRLLVWVRKPVATGRGRNLDLIAFDLIDPDSGAALEQRHAVLSHGGDAAPVHAAARRVVIARETAGRIAKGSPLRVAAEHGVNGLSTVEDLGRIVAIDIHGR